MVDPVHDNVSLRFFAEACERWASGRGDWRDEAAVRAVSTGVPLPSQVNANAYGLDNRGLAPDEHLSAYKSAKDEARARFHSQFAQDAASELDKVITSNPIPNQSDGSIESLMTVLAGDVSKAGAEGSPVVLGLINVLSAGVGRQTCAGWSIGRAEFLSLGTMASSLARALLRDGWRVEVSSGDDVAKMLWCSSASLHDVDMRRFVMTAQGKQSIANARRDGIIPAGKVVETSSGRSYGTRASWILRLWWIIHDCIACRSVRKHHSRRKRKLFHGANVTAR